MFEIIESLLHEPLHVKQYEEYLKDNSKYQGFEAALTSGYGYYFQKEEVEAFTKTYEKMQKIINIHTYTSGKEKQFYDNMQNYLNERISIFKNSQQNEFVNMQVFYNEDLSDKTKLIEILNENKKYLKIFLDIKDLEKHIDKTILNINKNFTFRKDNKTITNKISFFVKDDIFYGKIEKPSEFSKEEMYFEIKDNDLLISNIFNLETNIEKLNDLSYSIYQVKDFYENKFNRKLDLKFSNYNINIFNSLYQNYMNILFDKNKNNLDGTDIKKEFDLQIIKKEIKLYLNNEQNLENLIDKLNLDKDIQKIIVKNEEKFKRLLNKVLKIESYDKLIQKINKDEIESSLSNNKIDDIIKNNIITEKVKNIFKIKNDIDR